MKKILSVVVLWAVSLCAQAQFSNGQVLNATALNQALAAPTIPGGTITGLTAPLPLASGGTGAVTAIGAATNLQYQQGAAGSVARSLTSKFQDTVSTADFGADTAGAVDSTAAFTNAATASKTVIVPVGTYLLNSAPALGTSLFKIAKGTTFTGAGASAMLQAANTGDQIIQANTTATDFASSYVRRQANHTGGTPGFTSAGFRVDSYASAGAANYEWALTSVMNNSATGGQNVGAYLLGNRMTTSTGPTWGAVADVEEVVPITNPTTGSIGLEVDNRSNGTDANLARIGVDVAITRRSTPGAATEAGWGYRVQTNRDLLTTVKTGYGFDTVNTNVNVGFDTSTATIAQAAYKMAAGQPIAFDASAAYQLLLSGTTLNYNVSGVNAFSLTSTGAATFTDTSGGTGGLTINAPTNAQGASLRLNGNGATTPNKYIRAISGGLQIVNSGFSAAILSLSDAGALSVPSFSTTGSVAVTSVGSGLKVAEGANAKQLLSGALAAGTLTIANTSVTASSRILCTRQPGGTNPGAAMVTAITAATSFVVTSTNAADTGPVACQIFEPG